jgi:hypothetical protein
MRRRAPLLAACALVRDLELEAGQRCRVRVRALLRRVLMGEDIRRIVVPFVTPADLHARVLAEMTPLPAFRANGGPQRWVDTEVFKTDRVWRMPAPTKRRQSVAKKAAKQAPSAEAPTPRAPAHARPGRNEPCHCGSGRKYKHCHLEEDERLAAAARAKAASEAHTAAPEAVASPPPRSPKHQTQQPWKAISSRGFVPRTRTPRKVGGS